MAIRIAEIHKLTTEKAEELLQKEGTSIAEGRALHEELITYLKAKHPIAPPPFGPVEKVRALQAWWNISNEKDREAIGLAILNLYGLELQDAQRRGLVPLDEDKAA